jgi:hypothetical protein
MKPGWWFAGIVAAIAVSGTLWYLHHFAGEDSQPLCLVDDESALKNIGSFPPVVTEDDFDGMSFLF